MSANPNFRTRQPADAHGQDASPSSSPEKAPERLFGIPLNTDDIPRSELDIAFQTRVNPLPWKGQFSPQLVEVLLREYAASDSRVLDPFVGSGTVLGECVRRRLSASGAEVNPAAAILSRLYEWANRGRGDRQAACDAAFRAVEKHLAVFIPSQLPDPVDIRPQDVANLAKTHPARGVGQILAAALVLADPTWSAVRPQRLADSLRRVRDVLINLPESPHTISAFESDARQIPLENGSIDLVLTSPPYINVFNYHQQYRSAVEALGCDVLGAARSEIGSNRKHRMNRFLTVVQYCLDMTAVLEEMKRLLRSSGRMIFVVGRESRVRGMSIYNGDLLGSIAGEAAGLTVTMRQERAFTNRFGERIVEDILHFRTDATHQSAFRSPAEIAAATLERLVDRAAGEVRQDIVAAIEAAGTVRQSPLYSAS